MNKLIFVPILLIFINCTALNKLPNEDFESEKVNLWGFHSENICVNQFIIITLHTISSKK